MSSCTNNWAHACTKRAVGEIAVQMPVQRAVVKIAVQMPEQRAVLQITVHNA